MKDESFLEWLYSHSPIIYSALVLLLSLAAFTAYAFVFFGVASWYMSLFSISGGYAILASALTTSFAPFVFYLCKLYLEYKGFFKNGKS